MKNLLNPDLEGLEVKESQLLVATSDGGDGMIDQPVVDTLHLIRKNLGMDIVFVSEFVNGERVFRHVDAQEPIPGVERGQCDPLEETWCQRVVDGRLPEFIPDAAELAPGAAPPMPFAIGTFMSVPVRLGSGQVYGTVCCFSKTRNPIANRSDLTRLRSAADLIGTKLDRARAASVEDPWRHVGSSSAA